MEMLYSLPTTLPSSLFATSLTHSPSPPQELCLNQKNTTPSIRSLLSSTTFASTTTTFGSSGSGASHMSSPNRVTPFRRVGRSWKRSMNASKSSMGSFRCRLRQISARTTSEKS
ncbi:hypothetical protein HKD37_10G029556 [Glycine soja]